MTARADVTRVGCGRLWKRCGVKFGENDSGWLFDSFVDAFGDSGPMNLGRWTDEGGCPLHGHLGCGDYRQLYFCARSAGGGIVKILYDGVWVAIGRTFRPLCF